MRLRRVSLPFERFLEDDAERRRRHSDAGASERVPAERVDDREAKRPGPSARIRWRTRENACLLSQSAARSTMRGLAVSKGGEALSEPASALGSHGGSPSQDVSNRPRK